MNSRRNLISFIAIAIVVVFFAQSVSAQDRDAIIAKAKEEKVFVYYSTTDIRDGTAMIHAFQKKYPFVEPKLLRLGSTQVVVKVLDGVVCRGLQCGIYTNSLDLALSAFRKIHTGGVIVNGTSRWRSDQMPYGGVKDSGIGREGPKFSIRDMTEERLFVLN